MSVGLAVALIGLTCLALAILLVPLLLRRHTPASRESYNLAVYRDQLAEIDRDAARGLLSAEQAEAARAEIGRRILALQPGAPSPPMPPPQPSPASGGGLGRGLVVAAVSVLAVPFAAWLLYARLGAPALPDQPFAARTTAAKATAGIEHIDLGEAVGKIAAHLKEHPEDLRGWLLLGRTELSLGHYAEAVDAYRHAADLSGHRADIMGDWGEAQVIAADGTVTPAAREAFEAALGDKESAPRSRYYLALAKSQQGDAKGALQGWVDLAADAPADAEWLPLVQQRIAEAAAKLGLDPATLKTSSGGGRGDGASDGRRFAGRAARDDPRDGRQSRRAPRTAARRCRGLGPARPLLHGAERTAEGARRLRACGEAEARRRSAATSLCRGEPRRRDSPR